MNDWGTQLPDLTLVRNASRALEGRGFDTHTVTIVLNGQHGGWDVTIEATDEDLQDHEFTYILERHGSLEEVVI